MINKNFFDETKILLYNIENNLKKKYNINIMSENLIQIFIPMKSLFIFQ